VDTLWYDNNKIICCVLWHEFVRLEHLKDYNISDVK